MPHNPCSPGLSMKLNMEEAMVATTSEVLDVVSSIDAIPIDLDIYIASRDRSNRLDWEFGR
jgi:hypothetical protein